LSILPQTKIQPSGTAVFPAGVGRKIPTSRERYGHVTVICIL